jgi:hypothetical protein
MTEFYHTLLESFTLFWAWLGNQAPYATLFAYIAIVIAYGWKSLLFRLQRKQLAQYDKLFANLTKENKTTADLLEKQKAEAAKLRVDLKQERQLKGQYKQQHEQLLQKLN